jgi:hypothetical protein
MQVNFIVSQIFGLQATMPVHTLSKWQLGVAVAVLLLLMLIAAANAMI